MTTQSERQAALPSLTALRFVAAFAVLLFHLEFVTSGSLRRVTSDLFSQGFIGVQFFFVLSGFVLGWSARAGDSAKAFYLRRFARVYPAMLAMLLVAIALNHFVLDVGTSPTVALTQLFALQSWVPDVHGYVLAINPVAWTLSVEALFYASFPLLWCHAVRLTREAWRQVLFATAGAGIVVALVAEAVAPQHGPFGNQSGTAAWATTFLPLSRLPEFGLGLLLAHGLRAGFLPALRVRNAALAVVVGLVACTILQETQVTRALMLLPIAWLIASVAQQDALGRRVADSPGLVRLGVWSYSLYLVHDLLFQVVQHHFGIFLGARGAVLAVCSAALAVAASAVLYSLIEEPFHRRLNALQSGLRPSGKLGA